MIGEANVPSGCPRDACMRGVERILVWEPHRVDVMGIATPGEIEAADVDSVKFLMVVFTVYLVFRST